MTEKRRQLAVELASGLAGWLQLQAVQYLADLSGEDSARLVICRIMRARGRYRPEVSALPANWGATKKRVDVALRGNSASAKGWYGAIEAKWPGTSTDWHQCRLTIVQDLVRLAFIETNNLNAKFLVVGGSNEALERLFDKPHPQSPVREERRIAFGELLTRDQRKPKGRLKPTSWSKHFPDAGSRVPDTVFDDYTGWLKAELLASADARIGTRNAGKVFVWQASRTRQKGNP